MGKGDIKTRRGKIVRGTYGRTRPRKSSKTLVTKTIEGSKPESKTKKK